MSKESETLLPDWSLGRATETRVAGHKGLRSRLPAAEETGQGPLQEEDEGAVRREEPGPQRWKELRNCVAQLLEANCGIQIPAEKRTVRRYVFRRPLTITPVNDHSGRPDFTRSFVAFGIDISSTGIGFLSRRLVPSRKAIVTCDGPEHRPVSLLFEPRWVRFTRGGWYQTGGRLVAALQDEIQAPTFPGLEVPPDLEDMATAPQRGSFTG
jgi:hypothetical protein